MVDMEKMLALKVAILEAENADDYGKADKLRIERKRLLDADAVAEREGQKESRTIYVEAFENAIKGISMPKGIALAVTLKRTETGLDDLIVGLVPSDIDALMGQVHDAIAILDVPSTLDGITFKDGGATQTGKSARATGTGGGGGAGHMWQKDGGEPMKLDAAWLEEGGSKDDVIATKDGNIPFADGTGSQTWAHKKKAVVDAGYSPVTVEATS